MLNPIENVWSAMKAHLKSSLQAGFNELMAGDPVGALTQGEFRLRFLERCIDLAMPHVTPQMCERVCRHVQSYFEAAILLRDMPEKIKVHTLVKSYSPFTVHWLSKFQHSMEFFNIFLIHFYN